MDFVNKSIVAIMGPSGAGKTTLGEILLERQEISIPRHCTTRKHRPDDKEDFYRYLTHQEFINCQENQEFLIVSGDGPTIAEEYGNFYGVLIKDCLSAFEEKDVIVLYVSYKDIATLEGLRNSGINIDIVNLTFTDIESSMGSRLMADTRREYTQSDVSNRINIALSDKKKYEKALSVYARTTVFTDLVGIEQTYQKVCEEIGFTR